MTPAVKLVRNLAEKVVGKFYEGPEPPQRLLDMVAEFQNFHPQASLPEWVEFATRLAGMAYRDGYVRGFEQSERDPDQLNRLPPELEADLRDPSWRHTPVVGDELANPYDLAPEEIDE